MTILRSTYTLSALLLVFVCSTVAQADDSLDDAMRQVKDRVLAERKNREAARKVLVDADVKLGTWHRIGPFRDQKPLVNWMDNVASSFGFEFDAGSLLEKSGISVLTDCKNQ